MLHQILNASILIWSKYSIIHWFTNSYICKIKCCLIKVYKWFKELSRKQRERRWIGNFLLLQQIRGYNRLAQIHLRSYSGIKLLGLSPYYWKWISRGGYGQVYFEKVPQVISVVKMGLRITIVDNLISALALITIYMLRMPKLTPDLFSELQTNIVNPLAKPCWIQELKSMNFFLSPLLPPQSKLLSSLP